MRNNSPVAAANAMPFASARHPAVLCVGLGEELAGEGHDGLGRVPTRDPGAFGAAGCVVDERTAAVGRERGGSGAPGGELLGPAICVPGEWVGLLVRVARVGGRRVVARGGERATLERVEAQVDIVAGAVASAGSGTGAGWSRVGGNRRGMAVVVVVVVVVGMWWHPGLGLGAAVVVVLGCGGGGDG